MDNNPIKKIKFDDIKSILPEIEDLSQVSIETPSGKTVTLLSDSQFEYFNQVEKSYIRLMLSMSQVLDTHESYLAGHSARVALLSSEVARSMNLSTEEIEHINLAGHLHDIGEIYIPTDLLRKSGSLTDDEMEVIKQHPQKGADIIRVVKSLEPVAEIILSHHENFNGSGYPNGVSGEDIPVGARILAIVDTYDAITNFRLHKSSGEHSKAVSILREFSGKDYDPDIIEVFINMF